MECSARRSPVACPDAVPVCWGSAEGGVAPSAGCLRACPCILWVGGVSDRSCPWSKETVAQRGRHTLSSPEPEQLPAPTSRGRIGKAGPE